jgi:ribosome recycling factor
MAEEELVLEEAKDAMDKSLAGLLKEMSRVRTGRANPAILDGVMVDYYGTATPLKSLATVNVPEARLITVQPFDPASLAAIERAILKEDLGLTPINDGKIVRVPIPELTEERRKELVKQVRKMGEDHKLGIRHARRDGIAMLKEFEKSGELDGDASRRAQKKVQDLTDEATQKIDDSVSAKAEEILKI